MPSVSVILAIGDSLIAGYGLAPADSLPARLERSLHARHPGARVVNAGRSGDTTADVLARLPGILTTLDAVPDLAIVQVGPNDVLRGMAPVTTRANLEAIIVELGRCAIPVLLTTVEPPPMLRDRAQGFVDIHQQLAGRHGAAIHPFFPPGVLGHADMVLADRVHPNARAIGLVADALLPAIERALAPVAA